MVGRRIIKGLINRIRRLNCKHETVYAQTYLESHYTRTKRHSFCLRHNILSVWKCQRCDKIISRNVLYRNLHPDDYRIKHIEKIETGF